MSSHGPGFPNTIEYSANSYDTLREAQEDQLAGLGVLTPYILIKDNKQVQIKVSGYDDSVILDMDTAKLFNGTIRDATSGDGGTTVPYQGEEGELGGPAIAWPLQFQRLHFWGGVPRPSGEDQSLGGIQEVAEYYTYALCGQPVRVNPAMRTGEQTCFQDLDEEISGTVGAWNSSYENTDVAPEVTYDSRLIIGAFPGKTGRVATSVQITGATGTDGCYVALNVTYGIAYLVSDNYETVQTNITYNTGTIKEVIECLTENVDLIGTELMQFVSCATSAAPSGACSDADPCATIDNLIDCITGINLTGLNDCIILCD